MKPIEFLDVSGDYYENGKILGQYFCSSKDFQKMLEEFNAIDPLNQDPGEIKQVLNQYCPQLLDELKGIKDGMGITEEEALKYFAGYDTPKLEMGCTSFMTEEYYVRNYDFSPAIYDGVFIVQELDNSWITGNSQLILGRLDGMNHHGLVVGLHFVNNEPYTKGFLCSTIVRIVLEACQNVEEAIETLEKLPHAASYNYSLLDRSGNFAVFEATPDGHQVRRGESYLTCVNMFETDTMDSYNREFTKTSTDRLKALADYDEATPPEELHQLFSNPESPLFYTYYEEFFGTLHTVTYLPKHNQIRLTATGKTHDIRMKECGFEVTNKS
ncbi:C45 family autoproteolytic acyltransferase/hydolase [Tenuibacillus multivorans]|uniref:Predicted choloylglycine hydrolase n=1 Tax=Tenuibacillus multivorans TaxID=237069 RepID=A0A1H0ARZ7_9BACI|nr:C45 family peptidase [Tenuibacillus multivorans]GEL77847.1 choloylglycine hydrolase [Tenuibacillus multivorans]SDN36155.1 Predicted choloylglycine hydrolase [Tenuibacillus multivorans]